MVSIRLGNEADLEPIVDFQIAMALETEEVNLERPIVTRGVSGIFEVPSRGTYVVAEESGRLVGSVMFTKEWIDSTNSELWWLQSVFVIPEFRKQGVFKAMIAFGEQMAKDNGGIGVSLYVEKHNVNAIGCYEHLGYTKTPFDIFEQDFVIDRS